MRRSMAVNLPLKPNVIVALFVFYTLIIYFCFRMDTAPKCACDSERIILELEQRLREQHRDLPAPTSPPAPQDYCTDTDRNADPNHSKNHLEFWRHLSSPLVEEQREQWQRFAQSVSPYPEERFGGSGVVFTAGNKDTLELTLVSVHMLRKLGCHLPVEIWHLTDEKPPADISLPANVQLRDLGSPENVHPAVRRHDADKNFQIKAAAIINSRFEDVLYLDSDNLPVRDPTPLFASEGYKKTGAVFWPDYWKTHKENAIWRVLGVRCLDEWEQESGQIVVNKRRGWKPLQLAWYFQNEYEFYFQLLNGDKDTFRFAWKALEQPYHMMPHFVAAAGVKVGDRWCGHSMLQHGDDGKPLFIHANLMKITDRRVLGDHPWQGVKRYLTSRRNTRLRPEFWISYDGRACMDFMGGEGEPETTVDDFEQVLPGFRDLYFQVGGKGGEERG
ncbi:uncharacterized protein VTP21DRAFT_10595 [Calcarisporiella thermophila]|uniref:uncharacterized protein n=1 Tax=Calcarisporiella thermophila TaxID=911321 RepID=UPI003741F914